MEFTDGAVILLASEAAQVSLDEAGRIETR